MKIRLSALGLPKTNGILIRPVDPTDSSTSFQTNGEGEIISELYYQSKTGVLQGERLGTEHNIWVPLRRTRGMKRHDRLLINLFGENINFSINSITWQSDNIVRLSFLTIESPTPNNFTFADGNNFTYFDGNNFTFVTGSNPTETFTAQVFYIDIGNYINITGATNESNNGFYKVIAVGNGYIDIENINRNNNTDDEDPTNAIVQNFYTMFELRDFKLQTLSQFEKHYEINIFDPNE